MAINKLEAQRLVYEEINRPDPGWPDKAELVILEDQTIERPWGWVFFFQSDAYLQSGDVRERLAGNAPYIVNRNSSELHATGTAHEIQHYISEYEAQLR